MFRALQCPSSGARQTAVAASGVRMNVEVEVFSAVVGLLVGRQCLSKFITLSYIHRSTCFGHYNAHHRARQTTVSASGFRMNVEVEVFSAVVGLLVGRQCLSKFIALSYRHRSTCFGHYNAHRQEPTKLPLQPLVSV